MSRPSLDAIVTRKGAAAPASLETKEPSEQVTKAPTLEATKQPSVEEPAEPAERGVGAPKRRRPWDGQDEMIKANYEVPQRVQTKLHQLKAWNRVKNIKSFVSQALEAAIDKEIAKAEKEGY